MQMRVIGRRELALVSSCRPWNGSRWAQTDEWLTAVQASTQVHPPTITKHYRRTKSERSLCEDRNEDCNENSIERLKGHLLVFVHSGNALKPKLSVSSV